MEVKIKKLIPEAVIPAYAKESDAGLDLTATSKGVVNMEDHGYIQYGVGLSIEVPEGYVGYLFPRSSISNTGLILSNAVGVIDSGYRGEIMLRFKAIPNTKQYEIGERIAQLIIMPIPKIELIEVTELSTTKRDVGGFGSTN